MGTVFPLRDRVLLRLLLPDPGGELTVRAGNHTWSVRAQHPLYSLKFPLARLHMPSMQGKHTSMIVLSCRAKDCELLMIING